MTSETKLSPEVAAMASVESILGSLEEDIRSRVLRWAIERFGRGTNVRDAKFEEERPRSSSSTNDVTAPLGGMPTTLAEFYSQASPETDAQKALVAGYWFQFIEETTDLEAQKLNSELKHLGHRVGNITRALDSLKSQKPQLVIQRRKEGSTRQARKKYQLTGAGKQAVEQMLRSIGTETR